MRVFRRQNGAVLLLLFFALIMMATTIFLAALDRRSPEMRERVNKQKEMQNIKEELLSYAMLNPAYNNAPNGPGRLPCSDTNNNGTMNCNTSAVGLGRLPEQVIPPTGGPVFLNNTYAGLGQQYWYAVAPAFRQNSTSLNSNSPANLTLDGVGGVAAVIVAPGPALEWQVRGPSSINTADRYLEDSNATGPGFLNNHPTDPSLLNDMVVSITAAEVMTYASLRVAQEIRLVLEIYYSANGNTYPADGTAFATAMSANGAAWVAANGWISSSLAAYTRPAVSTATVQFNNCAVVYTFIQAQTGFTRSSRTC